MKDPTRIDDLSDLLRTAWEAQPHLDFPEFFARLEPRGIARNSTDQELTDALRAELAVHPWSYEGAAAGLSGRATVDLVGQPSRIVTIDSGELPRIIVRPHPRDAPRLQPVVWEFSDIIRCRPGEPLRIRGTDGVSHRLGIVQLISVSNSVADVTSLSRLDHGDRPEYLVQFDTAAIALLGSKLWTFAPTRRELTRETIPWEVVENAEVGEYLRIRTPVGHPAIKELETLGKITVITPL